MQFAAVLPLLVLVLTVPPAWAITPGQVDDFEDGTTLGWGEGTPSPDPPTNEPSGGPGGDGDAYLRNVSTGVVGPGGRLVTFNISRWKGNYILTGVTHVRLHVANFGAAPIHLRIGFEGTATAPAIPTKLVSREAVDAPPDGVWRQVIFAVRDLSRVEGDAGIDEVLAKVAEMRILSAADTTWIGDRMAAAMGLDNITAVAGSQPARPATWGAVKARDP
jgi:hypothetical protein